MQHTKTTLVRVATMFLAMTVLSASTLADGNVVPQHSVDYERDIKPLLLQKCAACHGALKQNGGLRLDAGELVRNGGDNGPVVQPGQVSSSLLIERVTAADSDIRMPPEGQGERLSEAQVDLLKAWIDQGANSPADEKIPEDPARYWSYQSPVRPVVPAVQNQAWVRNPIDAFTAAEHARKRVVPPTLWLQAQIAIGLSAFVQSAVTDDFQWFAIGGESFETKLGSAADRLRCGSVCGSS